MLDVTFEHSPHLGRIWVMHEQRRPLQLDVHNAVSRLQTFEINYSFYVLGVILPNTASRCKSLLPDTRACFRIQGHASRYKNMLPDTRACFPIQGLAKIQHQPRKSCVLNASPIQELASRYKSMLPDTRKCFQIQDHASRYKTMLSDTSACFPIQDQTPIQHLHG